MEAGRPVTGLYFRVIGRLILIYQYYIRMAELVATLPGTPPDAFVVKTRKVLAFDTEATGLDKLSKKERESLNEIKNVIVWGNLDVGIDPITKLPISEGDLPLISRFPNIIQFSYVLYDLDTHEYSMYNKYVSDDLDSNPLFPINDDSTHVTVKGALKKREEAMKEEKQSLMATKLEIINDFVGMLNANPGITLVGHNVAFDYRLMLAEAYRLSLKQENNVSYTEFVALMNSFATHCTCKSLNNSGARILNQKREWDRTTKKSNPVFHDGKAVVTGPRELVALDKLHEKLFRYIPKDLHDSLTDSIVTLRCYYRLMNPTSEGVVCGPGTPDIYLVEGKTTTPHLGTIQYHIKRITDNHEFLISQESLPGCEVTVLGGKRTRRKKRKSRKKKNASRKRRYPRYKK